MIRAYEQDYAGWIEDTALAIQEGRFAEIDRVALADEVNSLGISERERLESSIRLIVMHLLKQKYQPERQTRTWDLSIRVQRKHATKYLQQSPSLRPQLSEFLADAYDQARIDASNETGLDVDAFPETCEWTIEEVLG